MNLNRPTVVLMCARPSPYPSPRKRGEGMPPLPRRGEGWGEGGLNFVQGPCAVSAEIAGSE